MGVLVGEIVSALTYVILKEYYLSLALFTTIFHQNIISSLIQIINDVWLSKIVFKVVFGI